MLAQAADTAKAATAAVRRLGRQLSRAQQEVARLAAASYMGVMQSPMGVVLGGGNTQQVLQEVATLEYLTRQQGAREQAMARLMAAEQRAQQAARARIAELGRLLATLAGQRREGDAPLARVPPQSPVLGGNITPRTRP